MSLVNFNTKNLTYLHDFITQWTLMPSMDMVTYKEVTSIFLTMGGNKEEDMGKLSTPQLRDQTGHLRSMVGLSAGSPSVKFEFKEEEVIGAKIGVQ